MAKIHAGENPVDIVDDLIEFDEKINESVSYFICPSRKWRSRNIKDNCTSFVMEAFSNFIKKGKTLAPKVELNFNSEKTPKIRERNKLPHFRGIMSDIFNHIYKESPVPRSRFAAAGTLSLMSIVLGNKIKLGRTHPNLYCLMLANSGDGKDTPLNYAKTALMQAGYINLIGESNPASDTGIIKHLSTQNVRLDTIDEADILFGAITNNKNAYATKMSDIYARLFTSPGSIFEGKTLGGSDKKVGACFSPYVSMVCAMTPAAFTDSFTVKTIQTGLGARFLYFIDEERKRSKIKLNEIIIPKEIINFIHLR